MNKNKKIYKPNKDTEKFEFDGVINYVDYLDKKNWISNKVICFEPDKQDHGSFSVFNKNEIIPVVSGLKITVTDMDNFIEKTLTNITIRSTDFRISTNFQSDILSEKYGIRFYGRYLLHEKKLINFKYKL